MTFEEALRRLEILGENRMRLDLAPSQKLVEALGPIRFPSILISGTNGKGSTAAFLTQILTESGLRVGTYTSPHLESPTERISIERNPIDPEEFGFLAGVAKTLVDRIQLSEVTYFEFLTAMALLAFSQKEVDIGIFEVGLGGRLDSTNAIPRIGTITTTIAKDHTRILGNTLGEIAAEKGAIMRADLPAVITRQEPEAQSKLSKIAKEAAAKTIEEGHDYNVVIEKGGFRFKQGEISIGPLPLSLPGDHQATNAGGAVAMALELARRGFPVTEKSIESGLKKTSLPGRLETWKRAEAEVWIDVAHNPSAIEASVAYLQPQEKLFTVIFGSMKDKPWKEMIGLLEPITDNFILTLPNSPRAWDLEKVSDTNILSERVADPKEALGKALDRGRPVLVVGSFYLIGPLRTELKALGFKPN